MAYFRLKAGHTQESLSQQTGVARPVISRIESGAENPTIAMLTALVAACDAMLGEFFAYPTKPEISDSDNRLHEQLQLILQAGNGWKNAIAVNIDSIYKNVLAEFQKVAGKKIKKEGRSSKKVGISKREAASEEQRH